MMVIFGFSTEVGSSQHTSRFIGPVLRWFNPAITDETIQLVQSVARKGSHVTEYAILAALLWRAFYRPQTSTPRPWNRRHALLAIVLAALFAGTDEWHQSTVPSRQGQLSDVGIDTIGAVAGIVGIWIFGRWRRRWK